MTAFLFLLYVGSLQRTSGFSFKCPVRSPKLSDCPSCSTALSVLRVDVTRTIINQSSGLRHLHELVLPHIAQNRKNNDANIDEKCGRTNRPYESSAVLSPRYARITAPFSTLLGSVVFSFLPGLDNTANAAPSSDGFAYSLHTYFPGSITSSVVVLRVMSTLRKRDYRQYNTLMGSSLCYDEIIDTPQALRSLLAKKITNIKDGGVANLGGLGGVPFAGTAGFDAFASHCPDNGKIFIVFGPHVGISKDGVVGRVERIGMVDSTTSCSAVVDAYKAVREKAAAPVSGVSNFQERFVTEKLRTVAEAELAGGSGDDQALVVLTNKLYELILEMLSAQIVEFTSKDGVWDSVSEITIMGGILINRGHGAGLEGGEDFFQPFMMKSITARGDTDLFAEVFGDLPTPRAAEFGS